MARLRAYGVWSCSGMPRARSSGECVSAMSLTVGGEAPAAPEARPGESRAAPDTGHLGRVDTFGVRDLGVGAGGVIEQRGPAAPGFQDAAGAAHDLRRAVSQLANDVITEIRISDQLQRCALARAWR